MMVQSLGWEDLLEEEMATHSSILAWKTPWTVAYQAPVSMGFSRQEYWSGLPFPSSGDLPDSGIKPLLLHCGQTLYPMYNCVIEQYLTHWASQVVLAVKNLPTNAGDLRDLGSIPGLGRSPGGGHGNPYQYSCLENPMDRGAWSEVGYSPWGHKSQTRLSN